VAVAQWKALEFIPSITKERRDFKGKDSSPEPYFTINVKRRINGCADICVKCKKYF
jgi:hypothetical protein